MPYMASCLLNFDVMKSLTLILLLAINITPAQSQTQIDTQSNTVEKPVKEKKNSEILDRLLNNPKSLKLQDSLNDITGLSNRAGNAASVPEEFTEASQQMNWDPTSMTYEDMQRENRLYQKKKYLNWGYIGIGIISVLCAFLFTRKLLK